MLRNIEKPLNFRLGSLLDSILDGFGSLLGASGAPLGHFLGISWALLDVFWAPLGVLGRLWRDFGVSGRVSGGVQEGLVGGLSMQICMFLR